jgi:EamA-like transporter family protein
MTDTGSGHMPEHLVLGAVLSSLAFFCTAVMSALVKATEELTSTAVVLLFQNLICLVLFLPIALRNGWASVKTEKIRLHIVRAVSSTGAWYCLFVAILMMPLTNAILLTFSAPLWMPVIAWVLFREKASRGDRRRRRLRRCASCPAAATSQVQFRCTDRTSRRVLPRHLLHVRPLAGRDRAHVANPVLLLLPVHVVVHSIRHHLLATVRATRIDLPRRYRIDAAGRPGSHRARLPLRRQSRSARSSTPSSCSRH